MDRTGLEKKAYLLELKSKALADSMKSGSFKSLYRGQGIDFSGVREYFDGDDVRAIDWNVTARMGRPFVKMFDEERELNVFLVIDTSASMRLGSAKKSRLDIALECASLLTFASHHNSSPVGAVMFDGKINFIRPPKAGKDQVMMLFSEFAKKEDVTADGSVLDNALLGALSMLKRRTLIMIFSDFRTSSWVSAFSQLCNRNDVIAVRITDAYDDLVPSVGTVPFEDVESGYRMSLPTSSSKFKRTWSDSNYHRIEFWQHEVLRHGGVPLVLSTSSNPLTELLKFFATRN